MTSPERGRLEDRYNAAFVRAGVRERVCMHPDLTVTGDTVTCDYCPARTTAPGVPLPFYYRTD